MNIPKYLEETHLVLIPSLIAIKQLEKEVELDNLAVEYLTNCLKIKLSDNSGKKNTVEKLCKSLLKSDLDTLKSDLLYKIDQEDLTIIDINDSTLLQMSEYLLLHTIQHYYNNKITSQIEELVEYFGYLILQEI